LWWPAWLILALAVQAAPAWAQLQLARIQGVLLDVQGQPIAAAAIHLTDPLGGAVDLQTSDAAGRFAFPGVAPGRYALRAVAPGQDPLIYPLTIDAALPIDVTLRLPPRITGTVVVEAPLMRDSVTSRASVAGASVALVPVRIGARGLQDVVATLPGWAAEDNGLLHVRGIDDGFLYVVDGVPVYERLDQLSGLGPDLSSVDSVSVITGFIPAEFGYKAGGVIDVRSKSAHEEWIASAEVEQALDEGTGGGASAGGRLGSRAMLQIGGVAQRSSRFLDPVHPDNLHNEGRSTGTAGQIAWTPAARDRINANWGAGNASYQVPNTAAQEAAGQDQQQSIAQRHVTASWQRTWSPATVSQLSAYVRRAEARLESSPSDTPLIAEAGRTLVRTGAIAAVTHQVRGHLLKSGIEIQRLALDETFQFAVTDEDEAAEAGFSAAALAFDADDPFAFAGRATPAMWSVFLQDEWHPSDSLTFSAGLRFDASHLLLDRQQWSPRIGAAHRLGDKTVVRASVSRFFQPPQPENLLLSSSEQARRLSPFADDEAGGGAAIEPERQWAAEVGVEHWLGRWLRIDGAFWYRAIRQVSDPNVFAGTTIIFPNAVDKGRARGVDVRMEIPRRKGWSGYLNASAGRVIQTGPITGGVFLEDDVGDLGPGVEFTPDHDQRFVFGGGVNWEHDRTGIAISVTGRHESGTPTQQDEDDGDELMQRPGAELVDFESGRVKPRTVMSLLGDIPLWRSGRRTVHVRAAVLNLLDARYAYNFGNPFSGTHFGAPRTLSLALRARF
jgi:outer membrane receptor protein involved in Fe transport